MPDDFSTLGRCSAFVVNLRPLHDQPERERALRAAADELTDRLGPGAPVDPRAFDAMTSVDQTWLHDRFKTLDIRFGQADARALLSFELRLRQGAEAMLLAGGIDTDTRNELADKGEALTRELLEFAPAYYLTQGKRGALPLGGIAPILENMAHGLPAMRDFMRRRRESLEGFFGRGLARFPADPFALPAAALPGYLDCTAAVALGTSRRILLMTGLQEPCDASILDRFEKRYAEAAFRPGEVKEPAYRFRPLRLPFEGNTATAMEYYRTEQEVKEICTRLTSYDCLDGRYGLAMVAEAEGFTDGFTRYALATGDRVAPMDRDGLRLGLVRLVNSEKSLIKRMLFVLALDRNLPPRAVPGLGVRGFLETATEMHRTYDTLNSLKTLAGLS